MLANKKGLVFEGGGVLGIAYIGAMKELIKNGFVGQYFVGSSVGSIFALLMACRVNSDDLEQYVLDLNLSQLIDDVNYVVGIWRLVYSYGWHSQKSLRLNLEKLLLQLTGSDNLTFHDLKVKYDSNLAITAFSLTEAKVQIFDLDTSPTMNVIDACLHSCTVPFFFEAGNYLDGGLTDNYPINYLTRLIGADQTLGLVLASQPGKYQRPSGLYQFVKFISTLMVERAVKNHLNLPEIKNTISIQISSAFSFLDFTLDKQQKQILINDGQKAIQEYLGDI